MVTSDALISQISMGFQLSKKSKFELPKDASQLLLVEENECEKELEEYAQIEELDEPDQLSQTISNMEIDENNNNNERNQEMSFEDLLNNDKNQIDEDNSFLYILL